MYSEQYLGRVGVIRSLLEATNSLLKVQGLKSIPKFDELVKIAQETYHDEEMQIAFMLGYLRGAGYVASDNKLSKKDTRSVPGFMG